MFRLTFLIAALLVPIPLAGAQDSNSTPPPAFDESTVAALEINLTEIDVAGLRAAARPYFKSVSDEEMGSLFAHLKVEIQRLRETGTDRLVLSWQTNDLLGGTPLVQAPTTNSEELRRVLSTWFHRMFGNDTSRISVSLGWASLGSETELDRITGQDRKTTQRFASAMADRKLDHQLIVSLPPQSREDLITLWPDQWPPGSIDFDVSPRQLVRDITIVDAQWSLPPKAAMSMTLQTTSTKTAKRLAEQIKSFITLHERWSAAIRVSTLDSTVTLDSAPPPNASAFTLLIEELSTIVRRQRERAQELQTMNDLKQIGLAMHNYYDAFDHFPPPAIENADGDTLFSWRVALLPFLEQEALYRAFDKTQAWDSAANRQITDTIVPVFRSPGVEGSKTAIRLPAITGSMWDGTRESLQFRDITDGTSNTIAAAIAPLDEAVAWSKPEVWRLDENDLMGSFFGDREEILVLIFDGSVNRLKKSDMTEKNLRALLTIAGRDVAEW
ncbi:DUF1559 family PulG-like putative transporter [Allorhodopirellula solitaria]|uniref:DUF1559 domain-containing protein n=1 Tax=Allorhodopirellula solitaria TaxID=2527987 RepID=A0A5C5YK10_9BACT|nr:DUF1559 domain-containing protein [Allorhodopirellula solitaria]TWT75246.1 hypothetical protein CA85_05350 [Allorhodopirellula solitaria]